MIFKYEFFDSFMLMLSISFAIDGSLPIRQDENAMYLNAEGHSNRVDAESNQIKKGQDNLRKTDSGSTSITPAYPNRVHSTENLSNNEEMNLISNYDYDKYPSAKEFQDDMAIGKLNEIQNNEALENVTDFLKEQNSTTINDEIIATTEPFNRSSFIASLNETATTVEFPNSSKESITPKSVTNSSAKFIRENSSILEVTGGSKKHLTPFTTNHVNSSLFKSSMSNFITQFNSISQKNITETPILTSSPQHVSTIINSLNYSTKLNEQNSLTSYLSRRSKKTEAAPILPPTEENIEKSTFSQDNVIDNLGLSTVSSLVATQTESIDLDEQSTNALNLSAAPTLTPIEENVEESNSSQDNVTDNLGLSTVSSLVATQTESIDLDEQSTNVLNLPGNVFPSNFNNSDDSGLTTTNRSLDEELKSTEVPKKKNREFQSTKIQTTLSSLITNNLTFQNLFKARSTLTRPFSTSTKVPLHSIFPFSPLTSINLASSSSQSSVKSCQTQKQIQKSHERRVEVPDNELIDVYWTCPPDIVQSEGSVYKWFKVSSKPINYADSLPSNKYPVAGKFVLNIKENSTGIGARYVCINQNSDPFSKQEMHFYQIVVLQSKWIDVGSINTTVFYINQKAIINCPHGDIIKNNVRLNGYCCSSRITIIETSLNSSKDIFQCSNSKNTTIKMPAILSSTNCSLKLMGCNPQIITADQRNDTKLMEKTTDIINIDRCGFFNSSYLITARQPLLCPGKIYIRFYFDNSQEKCFPFETNICGNDFFSFASLQKCVETCIKIPNKIESCFYPQNIDESHHCPNKKLKGKYLFQFDIETGECQWFYHCGVSNLTKNVFQSFSQCNKVCILKKRDIKIESIKACRYQKKMNLTNLSSNSTTLWVYNKLVNKCETNSTYHDRIVRFKSKEKCENICKIRGSTEICVSRPDNGDCQQKTIQWFYNKAINQCVKILDGGCGESLNRFNSKISCEKMCVDLFHRSVTTSYPKNTTSIIVTSIIQTKNTRTKLERRSSNISSRTPEFRRRHHRQISEIKKITFKFNQMKTFANSTLPKLFNVSDRDLDFDPCFKEALLNTCEFSVGQNKYHMTRYTFKLGTGTCNKVKFSGCRSSENLFDDVNDCKSACESRLHATLKSPSCQNPFFNNCMAPDNVINKKINQRYFFLSSAKECVKFNSTSSLGCLNRYFPSIKQCQQTCIPSPPKEIMLHNRCFAKIVLWETSCSEDQKINRWFYFKNIDQCLQYATCLVNYPGNTFQSKQECENICRASNILTVCSLPMDAGVGELRKGKYYYNHRLGKCQLFYYNGSLGNLNRFKTRAECEKACLVPMKNTDEMKSSSLLSNLDYQKKYKGTIANEAWLNESIDTEYCFDSHKYGGCTANQPQVFIKKYYYDSYSKQCEPYMFSGCGPMSRNSFDSISICDKMCTERITRKSSSLCSQKVSKCSDSQWVYWMYNVERGICEPFQSCIKRTNHQFFFITETHCLQACAPSLPMKKDLFDICHLSRTSNENCTVLSERWFYDRRTRSCYSELNCEHYGNNFPSRISCLAACQPISLKDICQLPMDKGPCNSNDTMNYYFDWSTHLCKAFSYGGCLGNRNRFQTLIECQLVCPMKNQCNLKFNHPSKCDPHNLNVVKNIFHYHIEAGKCTRIEDFHCGDHTEFFTNENNCNKHCVAPSELKLIAYNDPQNLARFQNEVCSEPLRYNVYPLCTKFGDWIPRFYYNHQQDRCVFFYYNGCDGMEDKGNRFSTQYLCEEKCFSQPSTIKFTSTGYQTTPRQSITIHDHVTTENINNLNGSVYDMQNKPGNCPDSNYQCTQVQENSIKCNSDTDCHNSWKCCPCATKYSILSMCIEPLNCMTTKYGCCADGVTFAIDEQHLKCKRIKPTIDDSSFPELLSYNSQNDLILNCQVSSDPKPTISWRYLGNNSFTISPQSVHWDLLQPFWTGQIEIGLLENKYGLWICQANNDVGMDEKEVFVHKSVHKEPFLRIYSFDTNQSESINVTVNNRIIIHCPIYGYPRPAITWFLNKIAVNVTIWSFMIFNRHLLIEKAAFIHAGIWTCRAENNWGTISYKIRLRVLDAIQIIPPPMGTKIKANQGQQIILFCNVQVEGNCSINWYWEIGSIKRKLTSSMETDSRILKISSFQSQYLGSYVCEASNNFSSTNIKYTIVPYNTNEISINPNGAHFIGTTVILECPTKLSRKLSQTIWKKDNIHINTNSAKLQLVLRSKLESGFYSCEENKKIYLTYLSVLDVPKNL